VSLDEQHVALPKLQGAPAYARPTVSGIGTERPFDPDELPLEVHQTDAEREFVSTLPASGYGAAGSDLGSEASACVCGDGGVRLRPFRLRAIAGRLLGGD
jgi:hypothetical protein